MEPKKEIRNIKETLEFNKKKGKNCTLLIGAGCSVEAGIPVASEIVEYIKENFESDYQQVKGDKTYPKVMAQLAPGHRREVIANFVDRANINWAHIAIAQLMKEGYVDRILTTNFDPLVMKACALVGEFPAVYDFASSQEFKPDFVPEKAVFHLHGQRDGFRLLHTKKEQADLSEDLKTVFRDANLGRSWIVVGYSGDNDPVFEHLAKVTCYDFNCYWVTYKDNPPGQHVTERLCVDGKQAYLVTGYDADEFFVKLAQQLDCFPPDLVARPFTYVKELLDMFKPYYLLGEESDYDALEAVKKRVEQAILSYETEKSARAMEAAESLMAGDYQKVQELADEAKEVDEELDAILDPELDAELAESTAWSYIMEGNEFRNEAIFKRGEKAVELYQQAFDKFAQALEIKPDMHEALWAWGLTLRKQADINEGAEAENLYEEAIEKYRQALEIKPDKRNALIGWSYTHIKLSYLKTGKQAKQLLQEAKEKCIQLNQVNPGDGAYNLACASALLGESEEAQKWLEESLASGHLPPIELIESDRDLDSLSEEEWFKKFLEKVRKEAK